MKKTFLSLCILYFALCIDTFAASSPVVQVVSYKEPLGLYFSLQGWGSGSIVDNRGHIITNNHVVDDGFGGISDNFAVCMTDNPALPPRCHYTASVIDRDAEADIAVLQLDATDIFGKSIDFSTLSTLTMDMDYTPESGDTVVARGYPWVGANTITETQGIISGTAQYNGNTYIKTDTLIAGGNSGGPLIYDDVLVGINTFLIGGGYDPSLGYSLLISEVREFLSSAFLKTQKLQSNSAGFASFLKKIDTFYAQNKITDPLVTFDLTEKYTIDSYIPSMSLQANLSDGASTAVTSFGFYHIVTPRISDEKTLKKYILSQFSPGEDAGIDFRPVTINGRTFYEVIETGYPENDKLKSDYGYVSMLDETHMMILFFSTPSPTKNTLEKIQKTVQDFLISISFPSQFVFPNIKNIVIPASNIRLNVLNNSSVSYDIDEYQGILSYHIQNRDDFVMVRNYLGNFWNKAEISVFQNSFETEDNSIDIWLKNTTEFMYIDPVVKKKISYQGHQGFLVCTEDMILDESGKSNESIRCETILLIGEESEYIISTQMILPKNQLKAIETLMVEYLKKSLQIPVVGETVFAPKGSEKSLPYSDVSNQSLAFQRALSTLISYGILQNRPQFEGDAPLRWREYFSLFVWSVYHKRMNDVIDPSNPKSPTFEKVFSALPVLMDDYAEDEQWRVGILNDVMRLLVAGGSLPRYDHDTMSDFSYAKYEEDGVYKEAWNKITTFESAYFPRAELMDSVRYTPSKAVTYNPFTGLEIKPHTESVGTEFFRNILQEKIEIEEAIRCDMSSAAYFSSQCREKRKESLMDYLKYPVLTKGKAIENILGLINPALWKNEDTEIE